MSARLATRKLVAALVAWGGLGACADSSRDAGDAVVEIVGEGVISTAENQTFPSEDPVTGDLWFSVYEDSFDRQTIMVSRRSESGWSTPQIASFSGVWGDRAPRFSPDGSSLFITSSRPRPGTGEAGDMNLWRLARTESGWGEPELLGPPVNSADSDIHPSITSGGIWLASNRDGGMGRSDLYRIDRDGGVEHLGPPLNDELSQPDLWVSPDESWMILAITDHPEGYGGDDLYVSWVDEGKWVAPVNLGPSINTERYEYGLWVSRDGEYLYFTSHRSGTSHVYRVAIGIVRAAMEDSAGRPAH
jgi:Tol biopolymer transport system component